MTTDKEPTVFALPRLLAAGTGTGTPTLVAQGAEARVYQTTYLTPGRPCALKFRPAKPYRHPTLDARLTRQRILAEARILHRCRREGVPVPALYAVDIEDDLPSGRANGGSLLTEWVEGGPVRQRLNDWMATVPVPADAADAAADLQRLRDQPALLELLRKMGEAVGHLHRVGVVHGDLTTSNLMLSVPSADAAVPTLDGDVVIIDFGLASQSTAEEDRAVDLYVLERAFGSTHPRAEELFSEVLAAYGHAFKHSDRVLRKLEDVRMRGRKRSMLG